MAFKTETYFPGVYHIADAMGVCMTLVVGQKQAVLIDAGYGLESVSDAVAALTGLPCRLILSHGHHDHALGARWFDRVWLHPDDLPVYHRYTDVPQRRLVLANAQSRGLAVDEDSFLNAVMPEPEPIQAETIDLGGLSLEVLPCPGHTRGSLVFYVPEYRLLLTGDDWNPTTWLFFPEALGVSDYLRNMKALFAGCGFRHVLCSHSQALYGRETVEAFFGGLSPDSLAAAQPCPEGDPRGIRTGRCVPAVGQQFIFDLDQYCEGKRDD